MNKTIGIIGFGNLGKAFAQGLIRNQINKNDIIICARSAETINIAQNNYGLTATNKIDDLIDPCDIIIISIKKDTFDKLTNAQVKGKTIVSLMAGVSISDIMNKLNGATEIIRAMPTLSISNCSGIIGYTHTDNTQITDLFSGMGYAFEVEEKDIEKVTAYSACGLGFAAYLVKALIAAGTALGFDEETSKKIAEANFMAAISSSNYIKTIEEVATKGGATEAGICYLDELSVEKHVCKAVNIAYKKVKG